MKCNDLIATGMIFHCNEAMVSRLHSCAFIVIAGTFKNDFQVYKVDSGQADLKDLI